MSPAVLGPQTVEAPVTLDAPPVRVHRPRDHLGLWASLGVSLLVPVVAVYFVPTSLPATLAAIAIGTALGAGLLGAVAAIGARTGASSMVVFRGLFGARGSWAPTALNIVQCVGWAAFEVWIIARAASGVWPSVPHWVFAVVAGVIATAMALRPLGSAALLRRAAILVVVACSAYFLLDAARRPLGQVTAGGWWGLWTNVDLVASMSVSWIPLVADYTRHARPRTAGRAGVAVGVGYGLASAAFFCVGVLGLLAYRPSDGDLVGALLAVPAGALALAILAADEVDQAFANVYSTALSVQNLAPRADRRALAVGVGAVATALGVMVGDGYAYEGFLLLIGAVFTPLGAVLVVDHWAVRRGRYDLTASARPRPWLFVPWAAGFVAFELVTPTFVQLWPAWGTAWGRAQAALGVSDDNGWSAVVVALVVAAALTLAVAPLDRWSGSRRAPDAHRATTIGAQEAPRALA
ncbi:purine-cytosine permease family protein [Xylanimonas ulmi]|uniref:Putative hydroxymethylpyrimidine transporter CytX n=1 Tax=Xylanimonas ulmi TaxID=228973 RepID=A0A4Q7M4E6_9MICO|nr:cytosine permease [Xylanibacterium ulmi]RZS61388.1 putative hydroxymethylpyrimidine transporter CytX [Xylanibacterium ulmi]